MKFVKHRVNTLEELARLDAGMGAEIDLRSRGESIILNHDPFFPGDNLTEFVAAWASMPNRGTLILNPKEDGLENQVLDLMASHAISDFFFLDLTLPTTVKLAMRWNQAKVALRVSEYEPHEAALLFRGKADWVWLDTFLGEAPDVSVLEALHGNFRICLGSPELHGHTLTSEKIEEFAQIHPYLDAICTKHPDLWKLH